MNDSALTAARPLPDLKSIQKPKFIKPISNLDSLNKSDIQPHLKRAKQERARQSSSSPKHYDFVPIERNRERFQSLNAYLRPVMAPASKQSSVGRFLYQSRD